MDAEQEKSRLDELRRAQIANIRHVRAENIFNFEGDRRYGSSKRSYCVCRRQLSAEMIRCELCYNWFHMSCLRKAASQLVSAGDKFVCSVCKRSLRPDLEAVIAELASLDKIAFSLAPSTALRHLVECATLWQARACHSIHQALELIHESNPSVADSLRQAGVGLSSVLTLSRLTNDENGSLFTGFGSITVYDSAMGLQALHNTAESSLLGRDVCAHLEELMMLGELLEVTIPETDQLWQVLKATGRAQNTCSFVVRLPCVVFPTLFPFWFSDVCRNSVRKLAIPISGCGHFLQVCILK